MKCLLELMLLRVIVVDCGEGSRIGSGHREEEGNDKGKLVSPFGQHTRMRANLFSNTFLTQVKKQKPGRCCDKK